MTDRDLMTSALVAIDATLGGEAVAPEHAELAELTLLLAGERPEPRAEFVGALNQRAAARFGPARSPGGARRRRSGWLFAPAAGALAALIVAVVIVLGQGQTRPLHPYRGGAAGSSAARSGAVSSASGSSGAASSSGSLAAPGPLAALSAGRKVIQSSQLTLGARASQVESVAQQLYAVVARENGVINSSQVTASTTASGYGQFQLTVPSARLSQAMAALSQLHGARVLSRSDATQDVTGELTGAGRRLAEARALRTSLLRRLAAATTSTAVARRKAQLRDADAAIKRDLFALHRLAHHVATSQIWVTLNNFAGPVISPSTGGSDFTLGRALHDAGRVLVVAAGVTLIALAALLPAMLLLGVLLWIATAVRQRRREQVLDLL